MKTMMAELRPLRTMTLLHCLGLALAVLLVTSASTLAQGLPGTENGEWRYLGGNAGHTRSSPLTQINADNFENLEEAWIWRGDNFGPNVDYFNRSTPIYVDGMLYTVATPRRQVIAIDPATGEIKWHFQTTPREGWDYDGVNEVVAYEDRAGNKRWATADRNGYFYVLNREDGAFVSAAPFVKDITWASGIDDTGRPIFVEENRPGDPAASADGNKGEVVFSSPSFLGGKNWMPMAHSPVTGLFYVPSNEWGMDVWNEPITYKKGAAYLGSGFTIKPNYEDHIGSLKAMDPDTGEIKWEYKNDAPLWAGVMTTAGGLVFTGTPEGEFIAFDDETGDKLWSFQTGSGIVGQPITWEQDGEQFVTVISGWGGAVPLWGGEVAQKVSYLNQGGLLWTFRLPAQLASNN